jgi:hypothetical protein
MITDIQEKVSIRDCIAFKYSSSISHLGMIVDDYKVSLDVIVFNKLSSEISQQHSFLPLTAAEFPMAYHAGMTEVVTSSNDRLRISRSDITDIIFIPPISEVESGNFHMAGSKTTYFSRYYIDANGKINVCRQVFYFDRHFVEPYSH